MPESKFQINQTTSISIALVATLLAAAYWVGSSMTEQRLRLESLDDQSATMAAAVLKLTDVATDNKTRLDLMEQRLDMRGVTDGR